MASLQQLVEQLALLAAEKGTNGTAGPNVTPAPSGLDGPIALAANTFKMLFSAAALRDWAILLVIGTFFQIAHRLYSSLWHALIDSLFITAVFNSNDDSFQWIMHWLSQYPTWKRARNVEINTASFCLPGHAVQINPEENRRTNTQKVAYLPTMAESYTLWYKYHWINVSRTTESRGIGYDREILRLRIMTRDHDILASIVQDAKDKYMKALKQDNKIAIYVSASFGRWSILATRPNRSLDSIILDPGVSELIINDVRDFLGNKQWYTELGIPFRRGYLLYGAPGSGKTSLIHSIAGELGLDVYIISLSRSGMDDTVLSELVSGLPEKCIALMEDIDAAFHHGLTRESPNESLSQASEQVYAGSLTAHTGSHVSLSGLLNSLDGIGAQEGRILFATTNKYEALDPAVCRPGRMDLHIEFKLASRFQAEALFKRFYTRSLSISTEEVEEDAEISGKCENGQADVDEENLINLSEPQPQMPPTPPSPSSLPSPSLSLSVIEEIESQGLKNGQKSESTYRGVLHNDRSRTFSLNQINSLATQFGLAVPERKLSMASLQGFLMLYKTKPFAAVEEIGEWVNRELAERR